MFWLSFCVQIILISVHSFAFVLVMVGPVLWTWTNYRYDLFSNSVYLFWFLGNFSTFDQLLTNFTFANTALRKTNWREWSNLMRKRAHRNNNGLPHLVYHHTAVATVWPISTWLPSIPTPLLWQSQSNHHPLRCPMGNDVSRPLSSYNSYNIDRHHAKQTRR